MTNLNDLKQSFQSFLELLPSEGQDNDLIINPLFSSNQEEEVLKRVENSPLKLAGLLK